MRHDVQFAYECSVGLLGIVVVVVVVMVVVMVVVVGIRLVGADESLCWSGYYYDQEKQGGYKVEQAPGRALQAALHATTCYAVCLPLIAASPAWRKCTARCLDA